MQRGGYGPADHAEGVRLLGEACAYVEGGLDPAEDEPARAAGAALQTWARSQVTRFRAALERLHPVEISLLDGFESIAEGTALVSVASFLDRVDVLERSELGGPILETLARRGLDRRERARLRRLLDVAKRAGAPRGASNHSAALQKEDALLALSRWFDDWCATARALVTRKDWLIRLGLTQRRNRQREE
jgi:hypothetical protein